MKREASSRSPIRRRPVRVAGQFAAEQIQAYLDDKAYPMVVLAVVPSVLAVVEWSRWYMELPPQPVHATVLAVICWVVVLAWLPNHKKRLRAMRQGLEGERAVAEYLDRFRDRGYHVFHDVPGDSFNVDHVLIGPTGVYTLETKTISKPSRGPDRVTFHGESVRVAAKKPGRDPISQAKAQACWLSELLGRPGGRKVAVQPVVLYPGWFVEKLPKGFKVWVLEPKALEGFIGRESEKLSPDEVKTLAWQMKQYGASKP